MNGTRILYIFMLILGLGLIAVLVVWPLTTRLPRLNRDLGSMAEELDSLKNQLDRYHQQQEEYEELVRLFGPPLTDPASRMPRFVSQIQGLCIGSEVAVASIQPLAREESEDGWVRFPVQLAVRGNLAGLVRLLYRLRSQVPLTDVERLTVRAESKNRKNLTVQMLLSSYGLLSEEVLAERKQEAEKRSARR